jgi:hypothetical protein
MRTGHETIKALSWAGAVTAALGLAVVVGSRKLEHFDAALVAYTFAVLFASFGLTYRYAMWLQRPPTALYWRRGWQAFFAKGWRGRNALVWGQRVATDVLANRFIWRRDRGRALAHLLIMWGCLLAVAITFPLVFGWLHFRPVEGHLELYEVVVFGFPTVRFPHDSLLGFLTFHGLVWASFLVIAGVLIATRRRLREGGAAALQRFAEDFMPLILLFAVSITGLMLTASYSWMKGYGYSFIAILHAVTVIGTFVWLPFGKLFHVIQRPAQLGVGFYKDLGRDEPEAVCRRCGHGFSSRMHVEDLIRVERSLGFAFEMPNDPAEHYQWICPPCRRAAFVAAQSRQWLGRRGGQALAEPAAPSPMPVYVNVGQGPLGREDRDNFHP